MVMIYDYNISYECIDQSEHALCYDRLEHVLCSITACATSATCGYGAPSRLNARQTKEHVPGGDVASVAARGGEHASPHTIYKHI